LKSQTEEIFWIAAQEDNWVPLEIVKYAVKNQISFSKLLDLSEKDFTGISSSKLRSFFDKTKNIIGKKYQNIWNRAREENICIISYDDLNFPEKLKHIDSIRSILLYHKGEQLPLEKCVAIVGTRNCSTRAAEFTRNLSRDVAKNGFIVIAVAVPIGSEYFTLSFSPKIC